MARNSFYEGDIGTEVAIDTSASEAAASATAAASSATGAASSASAAATSATNAASSFDSFDDRYLGAKSSAPSVDNDGDALVAGALYWNTSSDQMFVREGSSWIAIKPTSTEQGHINTVSGIQANVTTVAGISSNVTTVAGISSDVTAVAGDATDIGAVAGKATEIGRLGTADAVADMAILGTADVVTDMNVLATADVVADMNTLGTADVVADMNTLGTADVVADMNTLGTADVVADMNTLGTADVVADLNTLGTADVVSDMNTLGTSANVTNMATLGASGVVGNIATVAGISSDVTAVAGKATEIGRLGTADAVADMNTLGTADVVADLNTLGTADVVSDMNTLGTADNVTNMNTVADNIAGVNSFADRYRVASSAPNSSLDEGDLYFNTTDNTLYHYTGSAWVAIQSYSVGDGGLTQINFTSADNTKLDGIEALANVTDTANVVAALTAGTGITISGGGTIAAGPIALTTVQTAANQSAHLALTAQEGDVVVRSDESKTYMHNGGTAGSMSDYTLMATPTDAVTSVAGNTGVVTNAHIAAAVEAASGSNTFTDADHSKLNAIEASATADQTASEILTLIEDGVDSVHYKDGSIDTVHIADLQVTTAKIAADAITQAKIADDAVGSPQIAAGGVDTTAIGTNAVTTAKITDDAVTADKLANSINTEIAANTAKVTNATHSGEVTGATALTIADNVVDEANLKVSNTPTNGYFLSAQSGNTGGMTWAEVDALPSQSSNSGKFLTTNGSAASWAVLDTDANTTTKGLYEHAHTIAANYSITSGNNAMAAGPITINSSVSVTIPSGSTWVIA